MLKNLICYVLQCSSLKSLRSVIKWCSCNTLFSERRHPCFEKPPFPSFKYWKEVVFRVKAAEHTQPGATKFSCTITDCKDENRGCIQGLHPLLGFFWGGFTPSAPSSGCLLFNNLSYAYLTDRIVATDHLSPHPEAAINQQCL